MFLSRARPSLVAAALLATTCAAAQTTGIDMSPERWEAPASTVFEREEGFPNGKMTLKEGIASAKDVDFSSGTVEFDIKALDFADTGIQFRRKDAGTAEFVYLRADPDCPAANDCIQYAPITHGLMQWDIYHGFQGPAPVSEKGWNHVRIVLAGSRMRVFVNREAVPSLEVDRLQGLSDHGGIALKGPAVYANLRLKPGETEGLADAAAGRSPISDPRIVKNWLVSAPTVAPVDRDPVITDMPGAGDWKTVIAEADGLVNLSRELGSTPAPSLAWLQTRVDAAQEGKKTVRLGWARDVWVFLDGRLVYRGKNPYYPADQRLEPDGRLSPDNATITLALHKGINQIVLAVGNRWQTYQGVVKASPYGWGAMMAYCDLSALRIIDPGAR